VNCSSNKAIKLTQKTLNSTHESYTIYATFMSLHLHFTHKSKIF